MAISSTDISCHGWALSADLGSANALNRRYDELANQRAMPFLLKDKLPTGEALAKERKATMDLLVSNLAAPRTHMRDHEVYICGGFRAGQIAPEHLWLEDHTDGATYDTMPGVRVRHSNQVGVPGQPFKPPSEGSSFEKGEIFRVRVDGFTQAQIDSCPALKTAVERSEAQARRQAAREEAAAAAASKPAPSRSTNRIAPAVPPRPPRISANTPPNLPRSPTSPRAPSSPGAARSPSVPRTPVSGADGPPRLEPRKPKPPPRSDLVPTPPPRSDLGPKPPPRSDLPPQPSSRPMKSGAS